MKIFLLLATFILLTTSVFSQLLTIDIPEHRFRIDPYNQIIVVQKQSLEEYSDLSGFGEIELTLLNFEFNFVELPQSLEFTGWYIVNNGIEDYNLFFTQLPLVKIQNSGNIPDEPKVSAEFYYADADQILIATIGIETRGGISQAYPKKTYDIEFWENAETEISVDVQFGNLRNDDDWILDAMYNEPLRIRSKNAHQLWLDIHQPHYLQEKPNAKSGADVQYVELFLNGRYNGIYMLSEQIDRKLLKINHFDGNINGEMYKGVDHGEANNFWNLPVFDNASRYWAGYEYEYPDAEDTTNWQNLYEFTDFVINSSDEEFENVWTNFNYSNYLDYFIYLNVLRATDNAGKNIYTAKLNSESPYFYVPWDVDGCFGTIWDGTNVNIVDDILVNGFISRVIDTDVNNYAADVSNRYFELRDDGVLHPDSLISRFSASYNLLKANNVYSREALVFPNYPFNQESFDYMENWIIQRMAFLDIYFGYEDPVSVDEVLMRKNIVYPNPATNVIYLFQNPFYKDKGYSIYNLQGQAVKSGKMSSDAIDISGMMPGFYIVKIGNLTQKIVIE